MIWLTPQERKALWEEYPEVQEMYEEYNGILEDELQDALNAVDDFIREIPQSDLRMMFRFYYLDDMTWVAVAANMNSRFPKRKYTEDSCRKRHDRYLEKIL